MASKIVLVHGFTQTAAAWPDEITGLLGRAGHEVIAVDAPGHGAASDIDADLEEGAWLLAAHGPAHYVGYSMGGRLVLHVALHHPESVRGMVLIGATPGIDDAAERAARRAADEELARFVEEQGVDAFLARWMANPLFATLPADAAALDARRQNTARGLASSLRLMGTGAQEPLWDRLRELTQPALLLTGALDEKFTAIAKRMASEWAGPATATAIAEAGHAVHLEKPDAVARQIAEFLHATTSAAESTPP